MIITLQLVCYYSIINCSREACLLDLETYVFDILETNNQNAASLGRWFGRKVKAVECWYHNILVLTTFWTTGTSSQILEHQSE